MTIILFTLFLLIAGCQHSKNEIIIPNQSENSNIFPENSLPEMSIYHLPSRWNTQNGKEIDLKSLRGSTLAVVMIYTSCPSACPRLLADMRRIEAKVSIATNKPIKYVMVSIDPETDTPQRMHEFASKNNMTGEQWLFLQGSLEDTRIFANVLAVKYKQISPMDFSHSNIISVFNEEGVLIHQQEGLGADNNNTIAALIND